MTNNAKRFYFTSILLIVTIIAINYIPLLNSGVNYHIELLRSKKSEDIASYINSFGNFKLIISLYFMTLQAVVADIMATHVIFAHNIVYGWKLGGFISWFGSMIGTTISFFLARNLLYSIFYRFVNIKYRNILNDYLDNFGPLTILMIKSSGFLYFDLITYLAGASSMRYSQFIKAVAIGQFLNMFNIAYSGTLKIRIHKEISLVSLITEYILPICILIYIVSKIILEKQKKR